MSVLQQMMAMGLTASAGNIAYRAGTTTAVVSAATMTLTKPAGTVSGDVLYAVFLQDSGALPSLAGWTQLATLNTTTNGFPCTILRKVAGGSEPSSYVFSTGATTANATMICLTGVNATPEDATTTSARGTTATITYPSITAATVNDGHLAIACNFNALASLPTGYSALRSSASWITNASKIITSTGAVSGVTSTGGGDWVAFSVLVKSS